MARVTVDGLPVRRQDTATFDPATIRRLRPQSGAAAATRTGLAHEDSCLSGETSLESVCTPLRTQGRSSRDFRRPAGRMNPPPHPGLLATGPRRYNLGRHLRSQPRRMRGNGCRTIPAAGPGTRRTLVPSWTARLHRGLEKTPSPPPYISPPEPWRNSDRYAASRRPHPLERPPSESANASGSTYRPSRAQAT